MRPITKNEAPPKAIAIPEYHKNLFRVMIDMAEIATAICNKVTLLEKVTCFARCASDDCSSSSANFFTDSCSLIVASGDLTTEEAGSNILISALIPLAWLKAHWSDALIC